MLRQFYKDMQLYIVTNDKKHLKKLLSSLGNLIYRAGAAYTVSLNINEHGIGATICGIGFSDIIIRNAIIVKYRDTQETCLEWLSETEEAKLTLAIYEQAAILEETHWIKEIL